MKQLKNLWDISIINNKNIKGTLGNWGNVAKALYILFEIEM